MNLRQPETTTVSGEDISHSHAEKPRSALRTAVVVAVFVGASVLCLFWPIVSETISDGVAYSVIRKGWSRQDVEKTLPIWKSEEAYHAPSTDYRVRYRVFPDLSVDVYYDRSYAVEAVF